MSGLLMKYFVVKPVGDTPYAEASRCAIEAYAGRILNENKELSDDLYRWCRDERDNLLEAPHE